MSVLSTQATLVRKVHIVQAATGINRQYTVIGRKIEDKGRCSYYDLPHDPKLPKDDHIADHRQEYDGDGGIDHIEHQIDNGFGG